MPDSEIQMLNRFQKTLAGAIKRNQKIFIKKKYNKKYFYKMKKRSIPLKYNDLRKAKEFSPTLTYRFFT